MKEEKACLFCGKTFIPARKTSVFCSVSCSKKAYYRKNKKPKYSPTKVFVCVICGKEFIPDTPKGISRRKYCSPECRHEAEKEHKRQTYKPAPPRLLAQPRECVYCGKTFTPDVNHSYSTTCSYACYYKNRNKIDKERRDKRRQEELSKGRKCICCGKTFIPTTYANKICSDECRSRLKSEHRKKLYDAMSQEERTALYKHKRNVRYRSSYKKVELRDNGICQICGSVENIQIHHINGRGEVRIDQDGHREYVDCDHSAKNLISLCVKCHKSIHNNLLVFHRDKWYIKGSLFKQLGLSGSIEIWEG